MHQIGGAHTFRARRGHSNRADETLTGLNNRRRVANADLETSRSQGSSDIDRLEPDLGRQFPQMYAQGKTFEFGDSKSGGKEHDVVLAALPEVAQWDRVGAAASLARAGRQHGYRVPATRPRGPGGRHPGSRRFRRLSDEN